MVECRRGNSIGQKLTPGCGGSQGRTESAGDRRSAVVVFIMINAVGLLWKLFKSGLLVTNAVAVLHRQRFLKKFNLTEVDQSPSASAMKNQVVGLISAVAYLRGPLIVLNTVACVLEIVL